MDKNLTNTIIDALLVDGHEAKELDDYSGRGMYGETTHAVVCNSLTQVISSIINNAEIFVQDECEYQIPLFKVGSFRWDSFGKGVVIY